MKQITSQQLFIGLNTALESMYNNQTEQDYWNTFYSWKDYQDLLKRPSDFAKFSLDFIKKKCQTSCGIWMWKWKRYQFLSTRRFRCLRPWCERRSCTENLRSWNKNKQSALFRSWCVKRTSKCVAKFWGAHNLLRAFSPSCFDRWSNHCIFLKL